MDTVKIFSVKVKSCFVADWLILPTWAMKEPRTSGSVATPKLYKPQPARRPGGLNASIFKEESTVFESPRKLETNSRKPLKDLKAWDNGLDSNSQKRGNGKLASFRCRNVVWDRPLVGTWTITVVQHLSGEASAGPWKVPFHVRAQML